MGLDCKLIDSGCPDMKEPVPDVVEPNNISCMVRIFKKVRVAMLFLVSASVSYFQTLGSLPVYTIPNWIYTKDYSQIQWSILLKVIFIIRII